jgi:hypothetical protein
LWTQVASVRGRVQADRVVRKQSIVFGRLISEPRDTLELWLMPQLLQDKPSVFFQYDGAPPRIHNEVAIFLNRQLSEWCIGRGGGPLPGHRDLQIWSTRLFPVGLCERWHLSSVNAYNPEQLEGSNTNSDYKNWLAFIAKCLARSRISSWCVQRNKWSTYWTFIGNEKKKKNFLSWPLQWCEFNFCVALVFLPINLCSRSHIMRFKSN